MKLIPKNDETKLPFEQWAWAKYKELSSQINPCDENGNIDPMRLNTILTTFAGNFSWAITLQEIESNRFNHMSHDYDIWYKGMYNQAYAHIREESGGAGRVPGQITIDARIVIFCQQEMTVKKAALEDQRSRVELLRMFVKVLDRQASILQTLSSNMRSELFFAAGVTVQGNLPEEKKRAAMKAMLHGSMRRHGIDNTPDEPIEEK